MDLRCQGACLTFRIDCLLLPPADKMSSISFKTCSKCGTLRHTCCSYCAAVRQSYLLCLSPVCHVCHVVGHLAYSSAKPFQLLVDGMLKVTVCAHLLHTALDHVKHSWRILQGLAYLLQRRECFVPGLLPTRQYRNLLTQPRIPVNVPSLCMVTLPPSLVILAITSQQRHSRNWPAMLAV